MLARLCRVVHAIAAILLATVLLEPVALGVDEPPRLPSWQEQAVQEALQDPDPEVGRGAVRWLAYYQASDARLATAVAKFLDRKQPRNTRGNALVALGNMGAAAADAVPAAAALLMDSDGEVRSAAVEALAKIGAAGAPVAPQLIAELARSDINSLSAAPEALGTLGAVASPFAPQVAALLKDPKTRSPPC